MNEQYKKEKWNSVGNEKKDQEETTEISKEEPKKILTWDEPLKKEEKKEEPKKEDQKPKEVIITSQEEEAIYAQVAKELQDNRNEGAWLKAFTENDGDKTKTKIAYTKKRVHELIEELKIKKQTWRGAKMTGWIEDQDYELAKGLQTALLGLNSRRDDNYKLKRFFCENIFLDMTDRTQRHPQVHFKTEERKYPVFNKFIGDFVRSSGMGNQKVVWELVEGFVYEDYVNQDWLHPLVDSFPNDKSALVSAKQNYIENKISFLDYWDLRFTTYNKLEIPDQLTYLQGVDLEKMRSKIKDILGYAATLNHELYNKII